MSVIAFYLIFSMLAVLWFDSTRYIIPNWLVGLMLLAYPAAVIMSPNEVDWKMALVAAIIVFAVGFVIFARRIMGAGDIKLIVVCALWVGYDNLVDFLFAVALLGGLLAVIVWCIRKALPYFPQTFSKEKLYRIFRDKEPVPYGIAIAIGFLIMMGLNKIPAVHTGMFTL